VVWRVLGRGVRPLDWVPIGLLVLMLTLTLFAGGGPARGPCRARGHARDGREPRDGGQLFAAASAVERAERRGHAGGHRHLDHGGDENAMKEFDPLGLDHIVVRVSDQEAAQRFYIDVLESTLAHGNAST